MKRVFSAIENGLVNADLCDSRRLFHGRGGMYDSLNDINVDWYKPVLLITLYKPPVEAEWQFLTAQLTQLKSTIDCVVVQRRYLREAPMEYLWGSVPDSLVAIEQGLNFALSLGNKQNIGFFLDMAPGREWLRKNANGKRVLNLFAYTCSFSVAAIAGGAKTVVNNDMSKAALSVGRQNHELNGHQQKLARDIQFLPYNVFRSWKKITHKGPYDIVIIDPPSRQKGSFVAEPDYAKVIRRLTVLMPQGGDVLACLNAPELDDSFLHELFKDLCPTAEFVERLVNREDFPEADRRRNLKMLHFRLPISES
jgi:23S rRNA (cytosine1962-C5)-methyltransferase